MGAASAEFSAEKSSSLRAIFWGGLIAGAMDITAACISGGLRTGASPVRVFQSVARGLIGADSFTGGFKTAALGLALHFLIATIWTAVFYLASRRLEFLVRQAVIWGALYGVVVYFFMYFVVLPLSAIHAKPSSYPFSSIIIGLAIHIFCVGLPIALVVRRYSK